MVDSPRSVPEQLPAAQSRSSAGRGSVSSFSGSLTPSNKSVNSIPPNLLPSAPASPPTPAPSPTPYQRPSNWQAADDDDDGFLLNARIHFSSLPSSRKRKFLEGILDLCDNQHLSFVSSYVGPRLRKDPFQVFPNELCLRVRQSNCSIAVGESLTDVLSFFPIRFWPLSMIRRRLRGHPKCQGVGVNS
jgi:F-box and WD-40 domain protein CDC4